MMIREPQESLRRKIDLLLAGTRDFEQQVEATSNLDHKTVVSAAHKPRQVADLREWTWATLCERWGLRVVGAADAEVFAVELPPAWRLLPVAPGSQWSRVLDHLGRERATLFHRRAVDARCVTVYLLQRYRIADHYGDPGDPALRIICARDGQRIFREFGRVRACDPGYFEAVEAAVEQGRDWLDARYPAWRDPFAYWDRP